MTRPRTASANYSAVRRSILLQRNKVKCLIGIFFAIQVAFTLISLQVVSEAADDARDFLADVWKAVLDCRQRGEAHLSFDYPEHGCNDDPYVHRIHCQIENLRIDRTKVHSIAKGGEPLDSVMGQPEEAELLKYDKGAFATPEKFISFPTLDPEDLFYLQDVFKALEFNSSSATSCDETWRGTTLFIQRIEYANLYHTLMDWWNLVSSLPNNSNNNNHHQQQTDPPVNLVFLDAHPQTPLLDDVWKHIIVKKNSGGAGRVEYLQRLLSDAETRICFERARFIPSGHTAPIEYWQKICADPSQMNHFVNYFLELYQLTHVRRISGRIVVIDRVFYRARPRVVQSNPSAVRALQNLRELALQLPETLATYHSITNVDVEVVTLVNQTMAQQIQTIRQASVVLASHGAGLSHTIFLDNQAQVVEMNCYAYHFKYLAHWKPTIQHTCIKEKVSGFIDENLYWKPFVVSAIAKAIKEQSASAVANLTLDNRN